MPTVQNTLFQRKLLQKAIERHLDLAQIEHLQQKRTIVQHWQQAMASTALKKTGEVALQGDFLIDIFGQVLGYRRQIEHPTEWQLAHEQKTLLDATRSDGALGFFTPDSQDIRAIIELKSLRTDLDAKQHRKDDKRSPVEQAFGYVHKAGGKCQWVIVSNYQEVRLYHASFSGKYEVFQLTDLVNEAEFLRFYYVLAAPHLLAKTGESLVEALYRQSVEAEQTITAQFYAQYTQARRELFDHLKQQNPNRSELALLTHTQQLLDRFMFICFCEDTGDLLPEKTFRKLIQRTQESVSIWNQYGTQRIWTELKAFFGAMHTGLSSHRIPGFNGELFKPDPAFDAVRIEDPIFLKLAQLTEYDFQSDLNVNILGHIFEQSLTDLEELRAEIRGEPPDRKPGKRKKEGIFYTPEYITRYIVEQAIGGWLEERQRELGWEALPELTPEDEEWLLSTAKKKKPNVRVESQIAFWEAYLERLKQITVLDPACGSGAFLTQAFDYLLREGERVNRELNRLRPGEQLGLFSRKTWDKAILRNNLFGVDLNFESVEITKLALWLKTAKKDDQLAALNQNIKCGNSLIDDPAVAGDKAFRWDAEFPEIMARGGFDVVIGNPPYVRVELLSADLVSYYKTSYQAATGKFDLSSLFIEHAIKLLHKHGKYSVITSYQFLYTISGQGLRKFLTRHGAISVIKFSSEQQVFEGATTYTGIFLFTKQESNLIEIKEAEVKNNHIQIKNTFTISPNNFILEKVIVAETAILEKFKNRHDLIRGRDIGNAKCGVVTSADDVFFVNEELINQYSLERALIHPILGPEDLFKWYLKPPQIKCIYPYQFEDGITKLIEIQSLQSNYPNIYGYFIKNSDVLKARSQGRKDYTTSNNWYQLNRPREKWIYDSIKIIYPGTTNIPKFALDLNQQLFRNARLYAFVLKKENIDVYKYLLAILNSRFCQYLIRIQCPPKNNNYFELSTHFLDDFPFVKVTLEQQQPFIEKADKMLALHQQLHADTQKFLRFLEASYHPKTLSAKLAAFDTLSFADFTAELGKQKVLLSKKDEFELMAVFEAQKAHLGGIKKMIAQTDQELDRLIYQLYGLTAAERQWIESSVG